VPALLLCFLAAPAGAVNPAVGLDAGYVFRSQTDGRSHGAGAAAFLDVPLPLWPRSPLGVRAELLSLGFGGSEDVPATLGLLGGALSLLYSFDDSDLVALGSVGPLAGLVVDGPVTEAQAGVLVTLGVAFPVAPAARLQARVLVPAPLAGPGGWWTPGQRVLDDGSPVAFPLQAGFQLGIALDLEGLFALAADGVGPEGLVPQP
jgi:hypothetical protein